MVYCSGAGSVAPVPLANPSLSLPGLTGPGMSSAVAPIVPSLGPTTIPGYLGLPVPAVVAPVVDPIGPPSDCLLLKNMFDPNNEVCTSSTCLTGLFFNCHYLEIFSSYIVFY